MFHNTHGSAVALSAISPNPHAFYTGFPFKPTPLGKAKLKLAYKSCIDYNKGTESALLLLKDVWQHDLSKIERLFTKAGWNLQEMAQDMKKVCFTLDPVVGFSYYAGDDTIILSTLHWLFGPSPAGFLYKNLRFKPTFEQALVLVHEFEHRRQAIEAGMIGATEEECTEYVERNFVKNEEDALIKELEFTKAYSKVAPKRYMVQCCRILGWTKQGDAKAKFESTREDTQVMLSEVISTIEDTLKFLHNGQQTKAKAIIRNSATASETSLELQRKLKLKLTSTIERDWIEVPF